ncbi:MAG: hypothetical protein IJI65_10085 [Lachnospiraceae bacterium]|nr:hypothetical protein [Lachnospiraceae bacterium]
MEKKLRRNEDLLMMSGWGAILMALFPVVDIIITVFLRPKDYEAEILRAGVGLEFKVFIFVFILGIMVVRLIFFVLAGRAAIGVSKREKKSAFCLVFSIILLLTTAVSVYMDVYGFGSYSTDISEAVVYLILDVMTLFIILEMLVSLCRIRSLRKKLKMEY